MSLRGLQNGQPKHLLLVDPEGVVRNYGTTRFESKGYHIPLSATSVTGSTKLGYLFQYHPVF
ncbi:unnamed protein product [Ranitomeya imitator]|uniref:Uncharacterized protein n=1 Tax=Ranitomeya imitator TaxID=111125 RepID=A0ABN9M9F4_9NEOB|nr:unnamed protein product [Ranitomeya imitator]